MKSGLVKSLVIGFLCLNGCGKTGALSDPSLAGFWTHESKVDLNNEDHYWLYEVKEDGEFISYSVSSQGEPVSQSMGYLARIGKGRYRISLSLAERENLSKQGKSEKEIDELSNSPSRPVLQLRNDGHVDMVFGENDITPSTYLRVPRALAVRVVAGYVVKRAQNEALQKSAREQIIGKTFRLKKFLMIGEYTVERNAPRDGEELEYDRTRLESVTETMIEFLDETFVRIDRNKTIKYRFERDSENKMHLVLFEDETNYGIKFVDLGTIETRKTNLVTTLKFNQGRAEAQRLFEQLF